MDSINSQIFRLDGYSCVCEDRRFRFVRLALPAQSRCPYATIALPLRRNRNAFTPQAHHAEINAHKP